LEISKLDQWAVAFASPFLAGFLLCGIMVFTFDLAWKYFGLLKAWREEAEREEEANHG